ncbi:HAD-IA family hydrolase, partial [candidate division KSB1 bacterium]|nr:HAD-IA family hydrolase [candidate division KSB1 bacterium]
VIIDVCMEKFVSALKRATHLQLSEINARMQSLHGDYERFQRGLIAPEDMFNLVREKFKLPDDYHAFVNIYTDIFTPNEEVIALVEEIAPHATLSVISNTDILHYQYLLESFSVMSFFHSPVTSFDVGALKPEAEIYHHALRTLDALPQQCFFVDDKPENIFAAQSLGMKGIVYQDAQSLRNELLHFLS